MAEEQRFSPKQEQGIFLVSTGPTQPHTRRASGGTEAGVPSYHSCISSAKVKHVRHYTFINSPTGHHGTDTLLLSNMIHKV
jgi:hypothetical protein